MADRRYTFDVQRAIGILNVAMKHKMFPQGGIPEDDGAKIVAAEQVVAGTESAYKVAVAVGKAKVPQYPAIEEILYEAQVLVGANGDGPVEPVSETLQQLAAPTPEEIAHREALKAAAAAPPAVQDEDYQLQKGEVWSDPAGTAWTVARDMGLQVEVASPSGELTTVPRGFLKLKVSDAPAPPEPEPPAAPTIPDVCTIFVQPERNEAIVTHPGCGSFAEALDGSGNLPPEGSTVQCRTCERMLEIKLVTPNGYGETPAPQQVAPAPTPPPVAPKPKPAKEPEALIIEVKAPAAPTPAPEPSKYDGLGKPDELISIEAFPEVGDVVYEHPGCKRWSLDLEGQKLPEIGDVVACEGCDAELPVLHLETNGYESEKKETPSAQDNPPESSSPVSSHSSAATAAPEINQESAAHSSSPVASSSSLSSENSIVDDDEGDKNYRKILDHVESDWAPEHMLAPHDIEGELLPMPDDLTAEPEMNRRLHSQFNALAGRARFLGGLERAKARDCGRARKLHMTRAKREARAQLGAGATLTEVKEQAEEDDDVALWGRREDVHAERAAAYQTYFEIYAENVKTLSRDLTWAGAEEQGS